MFSKRKFKYWNIGNFPLVGWNEKRTKCVHETLQMAGMKKGHKRDNAGNVTWCLPSTFRHTHHRKSASHFFSFAKGIKFKLCHAFYRLICHWTLLYWKKARPVVGSWCGVSLIMCKELLETLRHSFQVQVLVTYTYPQLQIWVDCLLPRRNG